MFAKKSSSRLVIISAIFIAIAAIAINANWGSGFDLGVFTSNEMVTAPESAAEPAAPLGPAPSCAQTVLANNNFIFSSTAPNVNVRYQRAVYLITAAELAAAGYPSGSSPTSIGWNYAPGGSSGATPLIVYMENTADTTNLKSTTWATAIGTMTTVHNGTMSVPASGTVDVPFSGGSPFTYTGGGIYVAFDWGQYTGTLATASRILVVNTGTTKYNSNNTAPSATIGSSVGARPETRLNGGPALNDAAVTGVISYGELPQGMVPPQSVKAIITNNSNVALTNLQVTLNVTGADTFTDMQTIPTIASCGGKATVTFAAFTPAAVGSDTVTVTIPADDVGTNNSMSKALNITALDYSYKHPGSTASGGVGVGAPNTAAFVGKFTTTQANFITDVKLEFFAATATTYKVAIYGDSGSGTPTTTPLYVDAADRTVSIAGPVTITLPSPVGVGPGNFFVGVLQTNTTNASISYDSENPIRSGAFYLAIPQPPTSWSDFATNSNNFKLNIGLKLQSSAGTPTNTPSESPTSTFTATATNTATATATQTPNNSCDFSNGGSEGLNPQSLSESGVAAPSGFFWSEIQHPTGNFAETNSVAGFGAIQGANRLADNFTISIPCKIVHIDFYAYQTGSPATPSPFTGYTLRIWDGRPGDAGSNIVFGDDTTNRLGSSWDTTYYRLFNTVAPSPAATPLPTPGTTRKIWRNNVNVGTVLPAGTYWLDWASTVTGGGNHFHPSRTIAGSRGALTDDARQCTINASLCTWADVVDTGDPAAAPDARQDFPFSIHGVGDGTATPTPTNTFTPTATNTSTFTPTPTNTPLFSPSPTPSCTPIVLYSQTDTPAANAVNSQDFEAANDAADNQGADDFVVPSGEIWKIEKVVAGGVYFNGTGPVASFNVTFYSDAAGFPGAAVPGGTFTGATYVDNAGLFTITLPSALGLSAGTYWVSVQARMDFAGGIGQWGWIDRTTTSNSAAVWQNPGGALSALCPSYARRGATCNIDPTAPDQIFQLIGGNSNGGNCATPTSTATASPTPTNTFTPTNTATATATATPTATCELIVDSGFEAGTPWPAWTPQTSTNFGTALCNVAGCGTGGGISAPLAGNNWAWFGGVAAAETATLGQTVTIPSGTATLSFYMKISTVSSPFTDTLAVTIDGNNITTFTEPATAETSYTLRSFDVSAFADGGSHNLLFTYTGPTTGSASFLVDDVSLTGCGAAGSIAGTITYGNAIGNPVPPRFIRNVSVASTAGAPPVGPVITGTPGTYSLTGFGAGAYTIKPTKSGGPNSSITSNDAARVAQGVVGAPAFVSNNQRFAADTSGNGGVTSNDAALIARFAAGLSGTQRAGQWFFFVTGAPSPLPTAPQPPNPYNDSRSYGSVSGALTGEDFVAILVGEASGNYNPAVHPRPAMGPERSTSVVAPKLVAPADNEVIIPVSVTGAADKEIISYEFDLRYDPTVIQPQENPVDVSGTVSRGLLAVANPNEPGLLRVVLYGPYPIEANGLLLNLRFNAVGAPGSVSPLVFERMMFNEGDPGTLVTDGLIQLSGAAANQAEITGRLLNSMGQGIPNARLTLADTTGKSASVVSNGFGVYRFGGLQVGQTYTISAESKQLAFTPLTVSVTSQSVNVDLIAN